MKKRKMFNLLKVGILLLIGNSGYAQTNNEIIKYFEKKVTPTVYFNEKAVKRNESLMYELKSSDTIKMASMIGSMSKTISTAEPGGDYPLREVVVTGSEGGVVFGKTREDKVRSLGAHIDSESKEPITYDYNKKIKTGELNQRRIGSDSLKFISMDIKNMNSENFLIKNYSKDLINGNIYVETGIEVCQIELPSSILSALNPPILEKIDPELVSLILSIDTSKIGDYYVFDSFHSNSNNLSHGDYVLNIIKNTLSRFNAAQMYPKVKKISLDYFKNRDDALILIKNYLTAKYSNSSFIEPVKKRIQYYENIKPVTCSQMCMPSDYLNILLDYYLMKAPEVISMSFYMKTIYPVMCFSIKDSMYTNLLGAVLNIRAQIENIDTDISGIAYEPMFTLKSVIPKNGSMLVGGEETIGQINCLYSVNGSNVSAIGHGVWNNLFPGAPSNYGTSWATPEVAVKLFIAKAFWKSFGMNVNSVEARKRLLLSCDLNDSYAGMFASAGIPNINKLLRKDVEGFIYKGDTVFDIRVLGNPKVLIQQNNNDQMLFNFKKGNFSHYLCGIYYNNGTFYLFQENTMRWEKVQNLTDVIFKDFQIELVKTKQIINISRLSDFNKFNINQIVRL